MPLDLGADLRRLTQQRLDDYALAAPDARKYVPSEHHPELIDLGRNVELLIDQQLGVLHVDVPNHYVEPIGRDRISQVIADVISQSIVRLLDVDTDLNVFQILPGQPLDDLVEFIKRRCRLADR